eukprot:gene16060-16232_t
MVYDDFVKLAQMICGTEIAVMNLIDADRQWFKAEIGLGVRETPLDISICAHAILQHDLFIVPDTALDPRFARNPLVQPPTSLRFYAGALLQTASGLPLGTLCVLDTAPRPEGLSAEQRRALSALGRQVMVQMELRRALAARIEADEARSSQARTTSDILSSIDDPFFVVNEDFEIRFANDSFRSLIGRRDTALIGRRFLDVLGHVPNYQGSTGMALMREAMRSRVSARREIFSEAMGRIWIDVAVYPISDGGLAVYVKNIDARKRMEAELEAALATVREQLAEKELLMLETHHRVKNSLQMVQSLLTLQARHISDPDIAQKVSESAARVNIFGSLHETLYRIADGTHVDLGAYLDMLVTDLNGGMGATFDARPIRLSAQALRWPAADVSTIGLVLTELVTNALKYGAGQIDVDLRSNPSDPMEVWLSVSDEGTGLAPDFEPSRTGGMGMRLITRLLRDRGARIARDRASAHTRFLVTLDARRATGPAG